MFRNIRIVVTGGGTGGHLFPLLAVASELKNLEKNSKFLVDLYYLGPMKGPFVIDHTLFVEQGIEVREIHATPNGKNVFRLLAGIIQSLWHLYWIMPDAVFSKGGYGALPVVIASAFYRIPVIIHESDTIPGKINLFSARFAHRIAVSFEKTVAYFPQSKTALVGNPVRPELMSPADQTKAREFFKLDPNRKTILVLGGSQGAKALNDIIIDLLPELLSKYQVLHQCGPKNFAVVEKEAAFVLERMVGGESEKYYRVYGFLLAKDLRDAYAASDIVVARAGSGQIFELALLKKPAILVPLPTSAGDHQRENAYVYETAGAAGIVEQDNLTPHLFMAELGKVLQDETRLQEMSNSAGQFAKPNAGLEIAKELLHLSRINIA